MAEQFDEMLDAIAFVGDALAPFFLEDPKTGGAQASFSGFVRPCPSGNGRGLGGRRHR